MAAARAPQPLDGGRDAVRRDALQGRKLLLHPRAARENTHKAVESKVHKVPKTTSGNRPTLSAHAVACRIVLPGGSIFDISSIKGATLWSA